MDITNNNLISSAAVPKAPEEILVSKPASETGTNNLAQVKSTPTAASQQATGEEQLEQAVSRINDYVQNQQRTLQFSVDEDSGRNVVKVLDKETDEVIRQIPQEEVLVIARRIEELVEDKVSLFNSLA